MDKLSFEDLIAIARNKRRGVKKRSAAIGGLIMLDDWRALELLVRVFADRKDHPNIRAQAANAIGRVGLSSLEDLSVVDLLLATLQDLTENEEVRAQAASALGELHAARAVEPLVDALGDASSQVRHRSAAGLRLLRDKRALNPLIELLHDESSEVRSIAASALAQVGDRSDDQAARATGLLIDLLSDESVRVRRSALEALGKLGGTEVLRPVAHVLLDRGRKAEGFEEMQVRWAAAQALSDLIELPNTESGSLDAIGTASADFVPKSVVENQTTSQVQARTEALGALLTVFNDKTEHRFLRSLAVKSLGGFGANDLLIRVLLDQGEEHGARASAAHTLGHVGYRGAVESLLHVLKNRAEPKSIRAASAIAIMTLKAKEAAGPLTSILLDTSEDYHIRYLAAVVLGELAEPSTVDPLLVALQQIDGERMEGESGGGLSPRSLLLSAVIRGLGKLGDKRAVAPLIALVRTERADANPDTHSITRAALSALGTLGDRRAVEPILALLEGYEEEDILLHDGIVALGEIGDKRAVVPLIRTLGQQKGSTNARLMAALMLGKLGDARAVEPLIEALEDTSMRVRMAAVNALGELGDPRALPSLERLNLHDEGETVEGHTVKEAASEAIEQIGPHLP